MSGPIVTGETTVRELADLLLARAVTLTTLHTGAVLEVGSAESRMRLRVRGSCSSDRPRSSHNATTCADDGGSLTLAEALSALLSEIPIVGGDHG